MIDADQQRAILTLSLMAAFADGANDQREREQIRKIADSLSSESEIDVAAIFQDVLLKRLTLADAARRLSTPESRQLAYEMAVCVCDADGAHNAAEAAYLEALRAELGLDAQEAGAYATQAASIADAALAAPAVTSAGSGPVVTAQARDGEAIDKSILNYAILNGALELLPQTMASMAIIPLQMKMVYAIGKAYGYELDRGHIKDLLATLGVGLTSQYVEEIGRKLLGGLLRRVGGGLLGGLGRQAAGSAMSFATTYALGHVAKAYYGGGRTIDVERLKEVFQGMLSDAQAMRTRYAGEIEQKAQTIDVGQLVGIVRQPL